MERYDIINALIKKFDYKSYCEIGVQNRFCFDKIECNIKMSVDPDIEAKASYNLTSDVYFDAHKQKFDIFFIDGLHEEKQVIKDIINALDCLNENGSIVVHDCNPTECIHQIVPRISKVWNGDVWKAWVRLRTYNYLDTFVVDTDYGCGVIRKNKEKSQFTYDGLIKNREQWLNLISVKEFEQWILRQ